MSYPPTVRTPPMSGTDATCYAFCTVDKMNSKQKFERRHLVVTKDFVLIVDGKRLCRAFWIREIEKIIESRSNQLLLVPKSSCGEPGLLVELNRTSSNDPSSVKGIAEVIARCHSANTNGEKIPIETAEAGTNLRAKTRFTKGMSYESPQEKLAKVKRMGLHRPSVPTAPRQLDHQQPPAKLGAPQEAIVPAPLPMDLPQPPLIEKQQPVVENKRPEPTEEQRNFVKKEEEVRATMPVQTIRHASPPVQRKVVTTHNNEGKAGLRRHNSEYPYQTRHQHQHRHRQHKKDNFWKEFVRDFEALEDEWSTSRNRQNARRASAPDGLYKQGNTSFNNLSSPKINLNAEMLKSLGSPSHRKSGGPFDPVEGNTRDKSYNSLLI
eukprot:TRINITY_DN2517_c0_g5_i1.p1 TRINITY_DN2517_c0_g5~~TRINITY_DN2517_c0_g5_i1.p1  ORF type:complete len:379 (+),score=48.30 TRINITY_DN2517_c0_g5_i1:55-1191(+)